MNMKTLLVIMTLLTAIVPSAFAADPVTDKVYAITNYAEQYEMGQISYAELRVYSGAIREDVRLLMSEQVFGEEMNQQKGVSEDAAKKFFGAPTEYTSWVWSSKEEKEIRLENKMPRWEKIVYDGKKIQVTFNAWPQLYSGEQGDKFYYWVDFNIRFKNEVSFDLNSMQSELAGLAKAAIAKSGDIKDFAAKLVEYSSIMQNYIKQNQENCKDMLQKFFTSEDKAMEQEYITWESELYSGDRLTIISSTRVCDSCEWVSVDVWFEPRYEGPGFEKFEVKGGAGGGNFKIEDLKEKPRAELFGLLREEFAKAKNAAESAEKQGGFHISDIQENIKLISRAISETTNMDPSDREEAKKELISTIDSIMSQYKTEKSTQKELRYEKRLVEDFVDKTQRSCRQVQEEECAIDEGCIESECKIAIGGDENCQNGVDDDSDTLVDCRDPDCARNCGKLCKNVCQDECWPCFMQCDGICKECTECRNNGGGEECNELCQKECEPCRNTNCWETSKCTECKACEEANRQPQEGECDMACGPCNECTKAETNATCEEECKPCAECKSPKAKPECLDKCKEITQGFMGMFEKCEDMCNKGVIFYCSGAKQYSPCDDTEYICNGNLQPMPCELFSCINEDGSERIQTVTCDQQALCGKNQVAEGDKCRCKGGFYDCDGDLVNCESETPCGGSEAEICDDGQDNDNDYMFDCEDLMDCREGSVCGIGKVCFDSKCFLQSDANVSARCGEGEQYLDGECKCMEGYASWEGKCVLKEVKFECEEGFILVEGACVPKQTECPEGFELKETVCVQKTVEIETNATECPVGFELKEGDCVAMVTACPSGYKLENSECVPEIMADCPSGYKLEGDECKFIGDAVTCAENEVLEAGKCISKDVFAGTEVNLIDTGKSCELASDCGSEREVCSNGVCKEIPQEIYDKEYGSEEQIQLLSMDEEIKQKMEEADKEIKEEPEEEKKEEFVREEEFSREEDKKEEFVREEDKGEEPSQEEQPEQKEEPKQEQPEQSSEPAQEQPITGAFFKWATGFASKEEKECASNEDCGENRNCDTFRGSCHCGEGWVDCNGKGNGEDSDGCESNDLTCGGSREICGGGCKGNNQYCNEKKGWCECSKGFYDCDGNWMNGCESEKMCNQCVTDDDCSLPVCAEWDNVVLKFGCVEEKGWKQENGVVSFSGGCNFKASGRVDSYLNFDAWGDAFQEVEKLRRSLESEQFGGWCKFERESMIKQRAELEKGMNQELLKWFFDEYLAAEPDKWQNRISGIHDIYWSLVENAKQTASTSVCTGEPFPEYTPIDIEYESEFGKVRIWEEWVNADEFDNIKVLTPYMEIWAFPPKEIIKSELLKAKESGYMPGSPEERLQEIGPSASEKEDMKRNPGALKEIQGIADDFGGSFDGLVSIKDGEEGLFYLKATINPEVIFSGKPVKTVDFEPDVTIDVQLDFLYDIIKKTEQHGEIQSPGWDKGRNMKNTLSNALDTGMIVAKITGAIATGDIKVKPMSAIPKIISIVRMMGTGGEKQMSGEQDKGGEQEKKN
ncbi:MAG: hypothetical protein WC852_02495 [Candidatus Nanoarchaeia archaeon]|jgi:hypothetical protein